MTAHRARAAIADPSFAERCGIALADTPAPLFRLLVASSLAGSPVRPEAAIAAARAVSAAGWTSARALAAATDRMRLRVLREAGYPRFTARAAVLLGRLAAEVQERYRGDLRLLRREAGDDPHQVDRALRRLPGIGPTASAIFRSEVEPLWGD